jgi:hypothetical protein
VNIGTSRRGRSFLSLRRIRTRVASSLVILAAVGALSGYAMVRFDALESARAAAAILAEYLFVHYIMWRFRLSPGVGAEREGLVLRNEYREHRIPWPEVADVGWGRGFEGRILRVRTRDGGTVESDAFKGVVVLEAERRRILAFIEDARQESTALAGTRRTRRIFGPAEVLCLGGFLGCLITAVTA